MKYILTFESLAKSKTYLEELEKKFGWGAAGLIKSLDPSKNYKYLPMICKYALDGVDFDQIKRYIKDFNFLAKKNQLNNNDIYSYKTFDELKNMVDEHSKFSKAQEVKKIKEDKLVIVDNDDFLILLPLTQKVCSFYGKGSKWCISSKVDNEMWYFITGLNILPYIVIIKNKKLSKQLLDSLNQYMISNEGYGDDKDMKRLDNFDKVIVLSYPEKDRFKVWTNSNFELKKKGADEFFKISGLDKKLFKNDLPEPNRDQKDFITGFDENNKD